jgi:hypothetical protein
VLNLSLNWYLREDHQYDMSRPWTPSRKHIRSATLLNTLVGTILGLEVEVSRPVVGEILGEGTGGAASGVGDIASGHGRVEAVSSNDLMDVTRRNLSGVHQRIQPVDDNLSTTKSKHRHRSSPGVGRGLGEPGERKKSCPIHVDLNLDVTEK